MRRGESIGAEREWMKTGWGWRGPHRVVVEMERRLIQEYLGRKVEMRLLRALAQGC